MRLPSLGLTVALLMMASSGLAQAIVLDRGQYSFGSNYQHTFVRNHVSFDGSKHDLGHIMTNSVRTDGSYGLTDRVTLDADATFISSKYIRPEVASVPGAGAHGRLDDGTLHGTLQDFHVGVRAIASARGLFVTPFVLVAIPSHHYQLEGHTSVGKGKGELTTGVFAGRDLGPALPRAYFEVMASHTIVQRTSIDTASERLNRTNASLQAGYSLTPSLSASVFGTALRTHGGWTLPRKFHEGSEERAEHDRFDKSQDGQVGTAVSYGFPGGVSIYTGYFVTVYARTAHQVRGVMFGANWTPRSRRSWIAGRVKPAAMQLAGL